MAAKRGSINTVPVRPGSKYITLIVAAVVIIPIIVVVINVIVLVHWWLTDAFCFLFACLAAWNLNSKTKF